MFVNSWARSTFDISTAPDVTSEKLPPGVPTVSGPELFEADQRLLETRCRPASLANVASDRTPAGTRPPPAPRRGGERGARRPPRRDAPAAGGRVVGHRAVLADRQVRRAGRDLEEL